MTPTLWTPTPEEIMAATMLVLSEKPMRSDALFIHGSPGDIELDELEITRACELYHDGFCKSVVLNGLSAEECGKLNLAYRGYEVFRQGLAEQNIPKGNIHLLTPAHHTAAESENLLTLAREHGWTTVTIMSYPHHQLRCFLQIVEAMHRLDIRVRSYNQSFKIWNFLWRKTMTKTILRGGEPPIVGTLRDHVAAEFLRIEKYGQKNSGFPLIATIGEAFAYLRERETI